MHNKQYTELGNVKERGKRILTSRPLRSASVEEGGFRSSLPISLSCSSSSFSDKFISKNPEGKSQFKLENGVIYQKKSTELCVLLQRMFAGAKCWACRIVKWEVSDFALWINFSSFFVLQIRYCGWVFAISGPWKRKKEKKFIFSLVSCSFAFPLAPFWLCFLLAQITKPELN